MSFRHRTALFPFISSANRRLLFSTVLAFLLHAAFLFLLDTIPSPAVPDSPGKKLSELTIGFAAPVQAPPPAAPSPSSAEEKSEPVPQKQPPAIEKKQEEEAVVPPKTTAPTPVEALEEKHLSDSRNGTESFQERTVSDNSAQASAEKEVPSPAPSFSDLIQGRKLAAPSYPAAAKRFGYEGVVSVAITIDKTGSISDVALLSSSGHSLLDREVIKIIKEKWSFNPPGKEMTVTKDFVFKLSR